eukprot:2371081-Pleurochrysis_carterae.AAC.2
MNVTGDGERKTCGARGNIDSGRNSIQFNNLKLRRRGNNLQNGEQSKAGGEEQSRRWIKRAKQKTKFMRKQETDAETYRKTKMGGEGAS